MSNKRIITEIDGVFAVDKIVYESWCEHLHVASYFINEEVLEQIGQFYPSSIVVM